LLLRRLGAAASTCSSILPRWAGPAPSRFWAHIMDLRWRCRLRWPTPAEASLEPILTLGQSSLPLPSRQQSCGSTKGSVGNLYVEPVNLGWHFRHLDVSASSGFFAPSGPYNSNARLNIGFGHWTGVFGLGGV